MTSPPIPGDLRAAFILEALTNDRLAAQRINLLPDEEIIAGPVDSGASIVMAAFLHADEAGGRFTDGRLGGWYAARELETAIAETMHHNDRRLRLSAGGFPNRIQIRELIVTIKTDLVDVRGLQRTGPNCTGMRIIRRRKPLPRKFVGGNRFRRKMALSLTACGGRGVQCLHLLALKSAVAGGARRSLRISVGRRRAPNGHEAYKHRAMSVELSLISWQASDCGYSQRGRT